MNDAIEYPFWAWMFFFVVVLSARIVDSGIANRRTHAPSRCETYIWSTSRISNVVEKFHYLKYGLAFILTFIGVKMLLPLAAEAVVWSHLAGTHGDIPVLHDFLEKKYNDQLIAISLRVVVLTLVLSIILSLIFPVEKEKPLAEEDLPE